MYGLTFIYIHLRWRWTWWTWRQEVSLSVNRFSAYIFFYMIHVLKFAIEVYDWIKKVLYTTYIHYLYTLHTCTIYIHCTYHMYCQIGHIAMYLIEASIFSDTYIHTYHTYTFIYIYIYIYMCVCSYVYVHTYTFFHVWHEFPDMKKILRRKGDMKKILRKVYVKCLVFDGSYNSWIHEKKQCHLIQFLICIYFLYIYEV